MNIPFKKIFVTFLLSLVAGAVLMCVFTGMMRVNFAMSDMTSNHGTRTNHFIHVKELILAETVVDFLAFIVFFLSIIIGASVFFSSDNSLLPHSLLMYFKRKRHDISHAVQRAVYRWLSHLENSPSSLMPT